MGSAILSENVIRGLQEDLRRFNEEIEEAICSAEIIVKSFENEKIVDSFYSSGRFGKDKQDQVIALKNALIKYRDTISGSLVSETNAFLNRQLQLLENGK